MLKWISICIFMIGMGIVTFWYIGMWAWGRIRFSIC